MTARSPRPASPVAPFASRTGAGPGAVEALRVATWNLRHARDAVDLGVVAGRIAALEADVVAVQEVDRRQRRSGCTDQLGELADRLGWHGRFAATTVGGEGRMRAAVPDEDDGGCAYGIGLLSRLPLSASTTLALPPTDAAGHRAGVGRGRLVDDEPRVLLRAAVSTVAGDVSVGVTHLSWVPWQAWRQLRSVLALTEDGHRGAVLAGDLNLPYSMLALATARSNWRPVHATATFPVRRPLLQLDHILVCGGRPVDVRVGPADPSDHRALRAAVVLGDPARRPPPLTA